MLNYRNPLFGIGPPALPKKALNLALTCLQLRIPAGVGCLMQVHTQLGADEADITVECPDNGANGAEGFRAFRYQDTNTQSSESQYYQPTRLHWCMIAWTSMLRACPFSFAHPSRNSCMLTCSSKRSELVAEVLKHAMTKDLHAARTHLLVRP